MSEYQHSRLPSGKIFLLRFIGIDSGEPGLLSDNGDIQSDLIHETLVIFVVSTTGSGQEPRTMATLWNMLLRSDLPNDFLDDMHFAVFGLGDSAYEKFCWPAKKLSRRLVGLGATQICHRGEGDDQHHFGLVVTRTTSVLVDFFLLIVL